MYLQARLIMPWRTALHTQKHKTPFHIIHFIVVLGFSRCMAKKEKNEEVYTPQEAPQLSNEEKELIKAAMILALAKRRRSAIMVTIPTLAKHIELLLLPFNIDTKTLMEYIKTELAKNYRLITLKDGIGNDVLLIEAVLLHNSIEELIEEFQKKKVDATIKIVDAELDSVSDYKQ